MPLTLDQLPDDIAELKRLLLAKNAELIAKDTELAASVAELAAAKNGLVVTQLTIEKLKAQIAKLKREKFGSSSERIERVLEQLELALEEAETAKAEALAAQPQQPEADATNAEARVPEKKEAPPVLGRVAAPRCRAHAAGHMQNLRRQRSAHRQRERHRGAELRPGSLRGDPSRASGVLVPQMRDHGAGSDAGAADPARHGRCELPRAHDRRQVLRPRSALSPGRDRCARRRRDRSQPARRMARPHGLAACPARRVDRRPR